MRTWFQEISHQIYFEEILASCKIGLSNGGQLLADHDIALFEWLREMWVGFEQKFGTEVLLLYDWDINVYRSPSCVSLCWETLCIGCRSEPMLGVTMSAEKPCGDAVQLQKVQFTRRSTQWIVLPLFRGSKYSRMREKAEPPKFSLEWVATTNLVEVLPCFTVCRPACLLPHITKWEWEGGGRIDAATKLTRNRWGIPR